MSEMDGKLHHIRTKIGVHAALCGGATTDFQDGSEGTISSPIESQVL